MPEEPLTLYADADRVAQILDNLLDNAVKYTNSGGHLLLRASRDGDRALIALRDDGVGIAPEMLASLFEPFTQVAVTSTGRGWSGLGLGLALVRSLAALHGGSVEARSAGLGQGSEFLLRLPLADDRGRSIGAGGGSDDEAGNVAAVDAGVGAGAGAGAGGAAASTPASVDRSVESPSRSKRVDRRVLVVDDSADIADPFAALLRADGCEVHVAYGGEAGLEAAAAFAPSVAFVDLGMPGMDGLELARRLRVEHAPDTLTLIALTGYGQDRDVAAARAAGFDHHLLKPVRMGKVRVLLGSLE